MTNAAPVSLFAYDAAAPLALQVVSSREDGGVVHKDICFSGANGPPVTAWLLEPATVASSSRSGVVLMHWGFGNRSSFLAEAAAYSRAGAVCLLLDAPGAAERKGRLPRLNVPEVARRFLVDMVVNTRRAVDVLCQAANVDADRIAYVGHSLGGSVAGQVAGAEPRFRAVVIMGGYAQVSRGWALGRRKRYAAAMEDLDGTRHAPSSRAAWLLQYGTRDNFVDVAEGQLLLQTVGRQSSLRSYDVDHTLGGAALPERAAWLTAHLGLQPPPGPWLDGVALPGDDMRRFAVGNALYGVLGFLLRPAPPPRA